MSDSAAMIENLGPTGEAHREPNILSVSYLGSSVSLAIFFCPMSRINPAFSASVNIQHSIG